MWIKGTMFNIISLFQSQKHINKLKIQIAEAKKKSGRIPLHDQYGNWNIDAYEDISALEDAFEDYIDFLENERNKLNLIIKIISMLLLLYFIFKL